MVSQAKLEANRRNAQKSTGPRTEEGKNRSRYNALDHGCRSNIPVLETEDAQEFQARKNAWNRSLSPRDAVEQSFVEDAVAYQWQQERARRAQVARLSANINGAGVEEAVYEQEDVLCLGKRLFRDDRGPLALYPHLDPARSRDPWRVVRISCPEVDDGSDDPARLVLHLQATASGCQWMIDQWAELRLIIEQGLNWQSPDKFKAVRLLGKQPMDAVDNRDVLVIFVACQTMDGRPAPIITEIWHELRPNERDLYQQRLAGRGMEKLRPEDAAAARLVLLEIVEKAMAAIKAKAEAHRHRAELDARLAADRLSFDDSVEGDRLRRYELANGRAVARSLDSLLKLRRMADAPCPLAVASGPLSAATTDVATIAEHNDSKEPIRACEIAPNEPTAAAIDDTDSRGELADSASLLETADLRAEPGRPPWCEWNWDQLARQAPGQADYLRKFNKETDNGDWTADTRRILPENANVSDLLGV